VLSPHGSVAAVRIGTFAGMGEGYRTLCLGRGSHVMGGHAINTAVLPVPNAPDNGPWGEFIRSARELVGLEG
jgi:hypothetical protein